MEKKFQKRKGADTIWLTEAILSAILLFVPFLPGIADGELPRSLRIIQIVTLELSGLILLAISVIFLIKDRGVCLEIGDDKVDARISFGKELHCKYGEISFCDCAGGILFLYMDKPSTAYFIENLDGAYNAAEEIEKKRIALGATDTRERNNARELHFLISCRNKYIAILIFLTAFMFLQILPTGIIGSLLKVAETSELILPITTALVVTAICIFKISGVAAGFASAARKKKYLIRESIMNRTPFTEKNLLAVYIDGEFRNKVRVYKIPGEERVFIAAQSIDLRMSHLKPCKIKFYDNRKAAEAALRDFVKQDTEKKPD